MQGDHPSTPGHYLDPRDRRTSRRTLQRARKALDAAHQKTNQGRGKDVERKSPKTNFPSQLANPILIAGHRVGHYSAQGKLLTPLTKKQIKAVEKTLRGKVPKQTFPLNLQIPHTTRDSHFPTASAS